METRTEFSSQLDFDQPVSVAPLSVGRARHKEQSPPASAPPSGRVGNTSALPVSYFKPKEQQSIAAWSYGSRTYIRQLAPTERRPRHYRDKRLHVRGIDCTGLYRHAARNELKRATRHLPPGAQRLAQALAADTTVGGQYYWSQERLGRRARLSRQKVNKYLKLLAENGLVHIPEKQRHYGHPKTLSFASRLLKQVMARVYALLAVLLSKGDTRKAKPSVEDSQESPSLEKLLARFKRKRRYGGGSWMVRCPCHADRTPSLSLSEGEEGRILAHCHAGCAYEDVRDALGLGSTWSQKLRHFIDTYDEQVRAHFRLVGR